MVLALILKDFFLAASWPGFLAPSARCLIAARFFNPAFFKNLIFGPSPIDFSARRLIFAARFCDDYIVEVLAPTARCFIATQGWPQELKLGKVSALAMVLALILKDFFLARIFGAERALPYCRPVF